MYSKKLVELIFARPFARPYSKVRFLERAGLAKRQAASKHLREIEKLGILESLKVGRELYYVNIKLMEALAK